MTTIDLKKNTSKSGKSHELFNQINVKHPLIEHVTLYATTSLSLTYLSNSSLTRFFFFWYVWLAFCSSGKAKNVVIARNEGKERSRRVGNEVIKS